MDQCISYTGWSKKHIKPGRHSKNEKHHFKNRCKNRLKIDIDNKLFDRFEKLLVNKVQNKNGIYINDKSTNRTSMWVLEFWHPTHQKNEIAKFVYDRDTKKMVTVLDLSDAEKAKYKQIMEDYKANKNRQRETASFCGIENYKHYFNLNINRASLS